jgi:hypothetical protein
MADRTERQFRFGPTALTTSAANILNGTVTSWAGPVGVNPALSGVVLIVKRIRIVNKTASAVTFSLFVGATGGNAAGTEVVGSLMPVAAYATYDWYGFVPLVAADFLTGLASANTSLTIQGEGTVVLI